MPTDVQNLTLSQFSSSCVYEREFNSIQKLIQNIVTVPEEMGINEYHFIEVPDHQ